MGLERKMNLKGSCTSEREINLQERKISYFSPEGRFQIGFKKCVSSSSRLCLEIQKAQLRDKLLLHFAKVFFFFKLGLLL